MTVNETQTTNKTPMSKESIDSIIKELTEWVTTDKNPVDVASLNLMKIALVVIKDLKETHKRELKESYNNGYQDGEFEGRLSETEFFMHPSKTPTVGRKPGGGTTKG